MNALSWPGLREECVCVGQDEGLAGRRLGPFWRDPPHLLYLNHLRSIREPFDVEGLWMFLV